MCTQKLTRSQLSLAHKFERTNGGVAFRPILLRANIGSKSAISLQWGPVDPKFHIEGVALPPTILLLRKLG